MRRIHISIIFILFILIFAITFILSFFITLRLPFDFAHDKLFSVTIFFVSHTSNLLRVTSGISIFQIKKPLRLAAAFAFYIVFRLCNRMRCGKNPHHTHHHITNCSDHFYFCFEYKYNDRHF